MTRGEPAASKTIVAAIDCGTNSTRLLTAAVWGSRLRPLRRVTRITRLGAGVDRTGRLACDAIARVVAALDAYARQWRADGARTVAVSATSAVRDVSHRQRFVDAVHAVAGVRPVVLTGRQEAALTFAGATGDEPARQVVCDIGGGSTECVVGHRGVVDRSVSLRLGSVRLRERHLSADPPTPDEYAALRREVDTVLAAQPDDFAATGAHPLIAVGGTATTVAGVVSGTPASDIDAVDGVVISRDALAQAVEHLAWVPARQRLEHPAVVAGREDVVVAGGMLLDRVMARFGFAALQVRVADLLDGVALHAAAGDWPPDGS